MLLRQPPLLFAALTLTSLVQAEELQLAPVEVTSSEASAGEVAQTQLKSCAWRHQLHRHEQRAAGAGEHQ